MAVPIELQVLANQRIDLGAVDLLPLDLLLNCLRR